MNEDFEHIEEYLEIMHLLASAIDTLQAEKDCHYGYLLPTLVTIKLKWERTLSNCSVSYWKDLVLDLRRCFEKRFTNHFNVTEVGEFVVIAVLSHPRFKSTWTHCLGIIAEEKVKEIMEKEFYIK